jgi:hypothetical protein
MMDEASSRREREDEFGVFQYETRINHSIA